VKQRDCIGKLRTSDTISQAILDFNKISLKRRDCWTSTLNIVEFLPKRCLDNDFSGNAEAANLLKTF
jgi:hypothetical protein